MLLSVFICVHLWLDSFSSEPFLVVFGDESVICKVGIRSADAIDFRRLSGTERFVWIETPDTVQQSLPAQHFMNAGDTTLVVVGRIEHCGVGIRKLDGRSHQLDG